MEHLFDVGFPISLTNGLMSASFDDWGIVMLVIAIDYSND